MIPRDRRSAPLANRHDPAGGAEAALRRALCLANAQPASVPRVDRPQTDYARSAGHRDVRDAASRQVPAQRACRIARRAARPSPLPRIRRGRRCAGRRRTGFPSARRRTDRSGESPLPAQPTRQGRDHLQALRRALRCGSRQPDAAGARDQDRRPLNIHQADARADAGLRAMRQAPAAAADGRS